MKRGWNYQSLETDLLWGGALGSCGIYEEHEELDSLSWKDYKPDSTAATGKRSCCPGDEALLFNWVMLTETGR